jgi:BirA family transcriptional regulator, biotin operon repressor / biotin---[acetyl-CoA-carboxylase] ligase
MQTIIQEKFLSIQSTHTYACSRNNFEHGNVYVICAESQTLGVGRRLSKWQSPKGNLYVTLVYEANQFYEVNTLVLCYTICQILEGLGVNVEYKWPNDLLFKNKKICGIIAAVKDDWNILSFGLNVNTAVDHFVCLKEILSRKVDLDNLRDDIVDLYLENLRTLDNLQVIHYLDSRLAYKGQSITYLLDNKLQHARLISLDHSGSLIVQQGNKIYAVRNACQIKPYYL